MTPLSPLRFQSISLSGALSTAAAIATVSLLCVPSARAQFHGPDGKKIVPQPAPARALATNAQRDFAAANTSATGAAASADPRRNGETISQHKFRTSKAGVGDVEWNYSKMIEKADVVWGQAENHPNGNYTVTKVENSTLIQHTYTQPSTPEEHAKTDDERQPVQRRMIQLDENGRPREVLIYDIRNDLKFRGELIFDARGYFREERMYDRSGKLVRTRIQDYDKSGKPLAIKTVIDRDAVDLDISLMVTGSESSSGSGGTAVSDAAPPSPEKESILSRIWPFGKKK